MLPCAEVGSDEFPVLSAFAIELLRDGSDGNLLSELEVLLVSVVSFNGEPRPGERDGGMSVEREGLSERRFPGLAVEEVAVALL